MRTNAEKAASDRLKTARLKAAGRCTSCGKMSRPAKVLCAACNRRRCAAQKQKRETRLAGGLCVCGKPALPDRTRCNRCRRANLKSQRKLYQYRLSLGQCTKCSEPQVPGRTECLHHAAEARARSAKQREATA